MFDKWTYEGHIVEVVSPHGPYLIDGQNRTPALKDYMFGTLMTKSPIRNEIRRFIDEEYEDGPSETPLSSYVGGR